MAAPVNQLRILAQTNRWVAIDKPAGFQAHSPEDPRHRVSPRRNCVVLLRAQLGRPVHLVHRLDRATSGVMLAALDPEAAKRLGALFQERTIEKSYVCVARGWMAQDEGRIDRPLKDPEPKEHLEPKEARTRYAVIARVELPYPVSKYPAARYTLARVWIETGRRHQIRRHFAGETHPLVGDSTYGVGEHNRLWREKLGVDGLLLKAHALEFRDPFTGEERRLISRWGARWDRVFRTLGVCAR
ncbi:MAG: tRNA pseudouridine(65) synthase TruC [Bdellovibrionales bacterium]|nr:tRNA pseudouridine(65) synthase TruC [Bdellovibrionales bacterium]